MKTFQERVKAFESQDPDQCLDNMTERKIYNAFLKNNRKPIMQHREGKFFLDFAFPHLKTAVEFNGPIHKENRKKDFERLIYLLQENWTVVIIRPIQDNYLIEAYLSYDPFPDIEASKKTLKSCVDSICKNIIKFWEEELAKAPF